MPRLQDLTLEAPLAELPSRLVRRVHPRPPRALELLAFSPDLLELLDLPREDILGEDFLELCAGVTLPPGAAPISTAYSGHQFGELRRLGDGRVILLGELRDRFGNRQELQLKGAGATPFARGLDGRCTERDVLREFLICEALFALGIPTARTLAVLGSPERVSRGDSVRSGLLVRLAPSFLRFGHLIHLHAAGAREDLRAVARLALERAFPSLVDEVRPFAAMLRSIAARHGRLVARWQAFGFIHGVLNTDNMALAGLTLDLGPCAFLETMRRGFTPNDSDRQGRYGWQRQPAVVRWNLARLAEALESLVDRDEAEDALLEYDRTRDEETQRVMRARLGLRRGLEGDVALVAELLELLEQEDLDLNETLRDLADFSVARGRAGSRLGARLGDSAGAARWLARYHERLMREGSQDEPRQAGMNAINPHTIPRSAHLEEVAAAAGRGDPEPLRRYHAALIAPFDEATREPAYGAPEPIRRNPRLRCDF